MSLPTHPRSAAPVKTSDQCSQSRFLLPSFYYNLSVVAQGEHLHTHATTTHTARVHQRESRCDKEGESITVVCDCQQPPPPLAATPLCSDYSLRSGPVMSGTAASGVVFWYRARTPTSTAATAGQYATGGAMAGEYEGPPEEGKRHQVSSSRPQLSSARVNAF